MWRTDTYPRPRALVLLALAWLALLAACNQIASPTPSVEPTRQEATAEKATPEPSKAPRQTPTTPPRQIQVDPASLKGVEVQFWHAWPGETGETVRKLVDVFNTSNEWGIRVEATYAGSFDDLFARVNAGLKGGQLPDLAAAYHHQTLAWNAQREMVDLSPYLADPEWGLSQKEQGDFYPAFWPEDDSGPRLDLPAQRSGQLLYYNRTWARELGFNTPPATPEQFKQQACASAQAYKSDEDTSNDRFGGYIVSTQYAAILGWIQAFGGQPAAGEGYDFDNTEVRQAFAFLRGLYDSSCAWVLEDQPAEEPFAARQGLFTTGSITAIPGQEFAFKQAGNRDDWTLIPFPSPSGDPAIDTYGPDLSIFPSTPDRQLAAWLFARWLISPEVQVRFIETAGSLPLRAASLDYLQDYAGSHPRWAAAMEALDAARPEPRLTSWGMVRWTVGDAATQLFRYYFTAEQIPSLTKLLDQTAADLNEGLPEEALPPGATP